MTQYEIYVFFLCLIVFVLLTALSAVCLGIVYNLSVKLIHSGAEDEKIKEEFAREKQKKDNKLLKILENMVTIVMCAVLMVAFVVSLYISFSKDAPTDNIPTYRVVNTGSMAEKNPKNTYLFKNNINDQIQTFDLIRTEKLPAESELEVYDIVVYQMDDILVVHRIVEIEEPNEAHPNERHFLLQGDAVESPDRFPVLYSQMKAIYTGDRIPFIGSFILFMQSPAGYLCILLVVIAIIATPLLNNGLLKARRERFESIGGNSDDGNTGDEGDAE